MGIVVVAPQYRPLLGRKARDPLRSIPSMRRFCRALNLESSLSG
jgi:hypothetical protein